MNNRCEILAALAASLALVAWSGASHAADPAFPARPIRLISPFAPGGGNDIISRILAGVLSRDFAYSVVVDNRPGANTIIGMELVAKATPDGYTLIMASSTQAINATLYPKLPYDTIKSFTPVSLVGASPLIVAVPASSTIRTVRDLIAAAKARPGELSYPSAGTGNATHLGGELFAAMAGIKLLHVPYKGSGPGITDLIAGRHSVVFSTSSSVVPHINSGRLHGLAITSMRRSAVMPELATVAESGVPGYEAGTWYGVIAPAGTPANVIARLHTGIAKALKLPDVKELLTLQGVDPVGSTPEDFAAYIPQEIAKLALVIKAAGLKPE